MDEAAAAEMVEMIETLNQRMIVMEVDSLRRNEERALEIGAMTAAQEAAARRIDPQIGPMWRSDNDCCTSMPAH